MWKKLISLNLAVLLILMATPAYAYEHADIQVPSGNRYARFFRNLDSDDPGPQDETLSWEYISSGGDLLMYRLYEWAPNEYKTTGKVVTSYNSRADGTGQSYALTSYILYYLSLKKATPTPLYAQWEEASDYSILYIGAGTGGTSEGKDYILVGGQGGTTTLAGDDAFVMNPSRGKIIGWEDRSAYVWSVEKRYVPGQTIPIDSNLRLTPIIGENYITYHYKDKAKADTEKTEFYFWYDRLIGETTLSRNIHEYNDNTERTMFVGWNDKLDGSGRWYTHSVQDVPHDLYAQYEKCLSGDYILLYSKLGLSDAELGHLYAARALDSDGHVDVDSLPVLAEPDGWHFSGWSTDYYGGNKVNSNTVLESGSVIYAQWSGSEPSTPVVPTEYYITLEPLNGDNTRMLVTNAGGMIVSDLPVPSREGYTFDGWYTERDGGERVVGGSHFDKDTTIYAHWTEIGGGQTFTVKFDLNYAGAPDYDSVECLPGTYVSPKFPVRPNFNFEGWFKEKECMTPWNFRGEMGGNPDAVTKDTTLYAKWTEAPGAGVVVTFDPNGGEMPNDNGVRVTGKGGTLFDLPDEPDRSGYIFNGWWTKVSGGDKVSTNTVFGEDTVVYAHWTQIGKPCTGEHTPGKKVAWHQTVEAHCTTTGRESVTYKCSVCGYTYTVEETIPALGHLWNKEGVIDKKPTCTEEGSKTIEDTECLRCGLKKDSVTVPIPAIGHTYGKWVTVKKPTTTEPGEEERVCSSCGHREVKSIPTINDDQKTYTVVFDPNGGSCSTSSLTTSMNGTLTSLPTPTWSGYTFDGWYTNKTGGERITTSTEFKSDTIVYARWSTISSEPNATEYRIYAPNYVSGGYVYVSHSSAAEGTRITIELSPRSGYEVDWVSAVNLNTGRELSLTRRYDDEYTFIMPASSVEVDAAFYERYTGSGNWYIPERIPVSSKPIKWYYSVGEIWHVTDGLVPYGTLLTRDMLISVLYNMDPSSTGEQVFWATEYSIVPDIYASGLWGVDKNISREQAAMILYCYSQHMGYNLSSRTNLTGYTDYSQMRQIARDAMSWAQATGLFTANSPNSLSPRSLITCGEANAILSRFVSSIK